MTPQFEIDPRFYTASADCRSSCDSTEWPLNKLYAPSEREGPLWNVEPAAGASVPMGVNDLFC